jgi:uncharacterized membrane protein
MKDKFLQIVDLIWIVCECIIVLFIAIPILILYHLIKLGITKIKNARFDLYYRAKIDKRP